MVQLIKGSKWQWIGSSSDTKPVAKSAADGSPNNPGALPVGATFLEQDTGKQFSWDGSHWIPLEVQNEQTVLLAQILFELRAIREFQELSVGQLELR